MISVPNVLMFQQSSSPLRAAARPRGAVRAPHPDTLERVNLGISMGDIIFMCIIIYIYTQYDIYIYIYTIYIYTVL